MKELIERERVRLQGLFDWMNREGSWMTVANPGGEPLRLGLVDSFLVTRVAFEASTRGEARVSGFWLLWKSVGYHQGLQFSHTLKVLEWRQDDPYELDFRDHRGWWHHVEGLVPPHEPEFVADWRRWRREKEGDAAEFERIDAELLEEHLRLAEDWPAEGVD